MEELERKRGAERHGTSESGDAVPQRQEEAPRPHGDPLSDERDGGEGTRHGEHEHSEGGGKHARLARSVVALLMVLAGTPQAVDAQATRPRPEIGVQSALGFVRADGADDWASVISVPGSSSYGLAALYATLWAGPRTAVEPQFALMRVSSGGFSSTLVHLNLQLMQFFSDPDTRSSYGAIQVGAASAGSSNGGSRTAWIVGGALGHRWVVRESLGVRVEGRYRRWLSDEALERDELALILGFGAVLGR